MAVLLKLNSVFGLDVQLFSDDDEARLLARLREACLDAPGGEEISQAELRELALNMPAVARARACLDLIESGIPALGGS